MKKVILISFGKLKTPGLKEATQEYAKRISRFAEFKEIELKPFKIEEKSDWERTALPEKEAQLVREVLESSAFKKNVHSPILWCLDETGMGLSTETWAKEFKTISEKRNGELVLIIGGSLGLGKSLVEQCHKKISLGPQTLTHEIARLVLTEQIYRALSLLAGHPYHNS